MLLVYSHKNTSRLVYAATFLLNKLCGFEVLFTEKKEDFAQHTQGKISYSDFFEQAPLNIIPHTLLFEKGIKTQNIAMGTWQGTPTLFKNTSQPIPFDIFAAAFFLLSRYEEYLPHISDQHGRFEADSSLAFQNNFLHIPLINLWALELKKIILQQFPEEKHQEQSYQYLSTIDVDNAWAFKNKGLMRTAGAFAKSLFQKKWIDIKERAQTLLCLRPDPYDTYTYLLETQKKYQLQMIYFFLLGNYGANDKNVSANNLSLQSLIKHIADYAETGIHPSYGSNENAQQVRIEINRLASITHKNVTKSRQHFLKLHIPGTYKNLINCGIKEDYTMGFASQVGFRAGVCSAFNWYDIEAEEETPLVVYPFCVMDGTLKSYMQLSPEQAIKTCAQLIEEVKKVQGTFITLWHNETLSDWRQWQGWRAVYEEVAKLATK
ncbi:MAG: polysaccharide deacetylase family protein [Bacteroidetes bacterium]|nr:polysaccharide deacetylase family protein [Bacteroidota bacterium]